ncbi:bifunctional helix-turn-helix transcriptional regulator/GNAT family N-acetyltransferase [Nocardioides sp.]|uniref:bifunctional helix-turn-helix transcriptional regulator/GNAT family N-acetyltransferase n=1 Tax=Nocardioides sp. TaxID=35761 RepID=UPI003D12F199
MIETVRRFNRTWTQRVGVLDDSFLGSGRALGPSRLLFEIGYAGASVQQLRDRLGLDSGYVSRLLRTLEGEGLVTMGPDPADRRRRIVTLTDPGRKAWCDLEERSDRLAQHLLEPLSERHRTRLVEALDAAERLARAATVELRVVDPATASARTAVAHYYRELAALFDFDPGDPTADEPGLRGPGGAFLVALSDGEPVACGAVRRLDGSTGEFKRMWVHEDWRGLGLGGRVLRRLEAEARTLGYKRVRLDTNNALDAAIGMYLTAGYRRIERYNDNLYAQQWFEGDLQPGI